MNADIVNAAFQVLSGVFILNHAMAAWKTRQAFGTSQLSTAFFACWGMWNLWYFPHLNQPVSFYASVAALGANIFWIYTIWYLRREARRETR